MAQNTLAVSLESSEKEKPRGKTYRIPVSNGIFEHYPKLKDARWLLDLFVDWTTKEVQVADGSFDGLVLGGKPIRDEDTAGPFRCSSRTTRRWRQRLAGYGYISQLRTPNGYVIRVKKSKKWPKGADKIGRSELPSVSDQTGHDRQFRTTDHGRCNKTVQGQDRDIAVEDVAAPANLPLKEKGRKILKAAWDNVGLEPTGSIRFCEAWEQTYADAPGDDLILTIMERAIQHCQSNGVRVPPPFYEAKRRIEKEGDGESDEVARVASALRTMSDKYAHLVKPKSELPRLRPRD
jgi:hypothetical protein